MSSGERVLGFLLSVVLLGVPGAVAAEEGTIIEDGVLDWIHLYADRIPGDAVIVVDSFDASEADLGTGAEGGKPKRVEAAKTMQQDAPPLLLTEIIRHVSEMGRFPDVVPAKPAMAMPENALLIEGHFTILDPGSRAKRYWGGFGAGKGRWEIAGTVKDSSGHLLAEFRQKRITVMGAFGGDAVKKMKSDCDRLGKDIAQFLNAWANGEGLEDD